MSNPQIKSILGALSPANDNENSREVSDSARDSAISVEDIVHSSALSVPDVTTTTAGGPTLTPTSERSLTPTNSRRGGESTKLTAAASQLSIPLTSRELDGTSTANIIQGPRIRKATTKMIDPGSVETGSPPSKVAKVKGGAVNLPKKKKKVTSAVVKATAQTPATIYKQPAFPTGVYTGISSPSASASTRTPAQATTYAPTLPLSGELCRLPSFSIDLTKIAEYPFMPDDGVDDWADFIGDPSSYINHRDLCDTIASFFIQRAFRGRSGGETWLQFEASEKAVSNVSSDLDNGLRLAVLQALAPALSTQIWDAPREVKKAINPAMAPKRNHKKRKVVTTADGDEIAVRLGNPPPVSSHERWAQDKFGMWQPLYGDETAVPNGIELSMRKSGIGELSGLLPRTHPVSVEPSSEMHNTPALTEAAPAFGGQTALEDVALRPLDLETSDEEGD